ncbi:DUF7146 domain-containing protein [Rhodomicrobium lacus]|uniref:DUF7146 domain-containing protein n=1 Tax=Rhodomicrobium lacus TaxID=2498452 RepID=UPI000F8C3BE1|nr:CHC2 zinc finger domain-containing protein [Rhodomicrobium lacus]
MRQGIDIESVKAAHRIEDVVRNRYHVALKRDGREFVGLSPFKRERTASFYVHPGKQVFKCFASDEGGDVIRFVQLMDGCDFREALQTLAGWAGLLPREDDDAEARERREKAAQAQAEKRRVQEAATEEEERREKAAKLRRARAIWDECVPARGTLVEVYLRWRCINLDAMEAVYGFLIPASLRFHPALEYHRQDVHHVGPAMVGAILTRDRDFAGVHRTWLAPDGRGKARLPKAKLALGNVWGSLGFLTPFAADAIMGEGYETTLSVMSDLAEVGRRACFFSGLSLGNMTGGGLNAVPTLDKIGALMPRGVERLTLLGDADGKDPARTRLMLDRGALKFRQVQGIDTRIAMAAPGKDFNDMLMERRCANRG